MRVAVPTEGLGGETRRRVVFGWSTTRSRPQARSDAMELSEPDETHFPLRGTVIGSSFHAALPTRTRPNEPEHRCGLRDTQTGQRRLDARVRAARPCARALHLGEC